MSFRLLYVETHLQRTFLSGASLPLDVRAHPKAGARIDLSSASDEGDSRGQSLSVIIGNNGTGKSRLLGDIANAFVFLERGSQRPRRFPLKRLAYSASGRVYEIVCTEDTLDASIDGQPVEVSELVIPQTIALTLTPFDKFPLPRQIRFGSDQPDQEASKYAYFGLRDHTNRASIMALLYRSVERLSEASRSSAKRRNEVAGVFGFLGYRPRIRLVYRFRISPGSFDELLRAGLEPRNIDSSIVFRSVSDALASGKITQSDLSDAIHLVLSSNRRERYLELFLDFDGASDNSDLFRAAGLLRSVRLISLQTVEIERIDGAHFNLRDASSGELSIVTSFLALATTLDDSSLILIDEPEISLHPAWQNRYIDLLLGTFASYTGCHYIVATHSPLILSDSSVIASNVVYLDSDPGLEAAALAGQSPDFLLVNAFKVPGRNNYYLKQELVSVLRLVADGKVGSEEFEQKMRILSPLRERLDAKDPVRDVISQLENLKTTGEVFL
jgi:predicted ATPase